MTASFVHLRLHTEYSLVDGLVRVKPLIKAVAGAGMPAVAVTDMSNMCSLVKFYKAAMGAGIKPICGADLWLAGADPEAKVIVVTGAGRGFSAGLDLAIIGGGGSGDVNPCPDSAPQWGDDIGPALAPYYSGGWPVLITSSSILIAFAFSAAVGIFFGLYPANRASLLDPVDALRAE